MELEPEDRILAKPPPHLLGKITWDEFAQTLDEDTRRRGVVDVPPSSVHEVAGLVGLLELPPSYREYTERFGNLGEWNLAYDVERYPRFLTIWDFQGLKEDLDYFHTILDAMEKQDDQGRILANSLRRLVPIGTDAGGTFLCWDPERRGRDGELGLCFIEEDDWTSAPESVRHDCGADLLDVIKFFRYP